MPAQALYSNTADIIATFGIGSGRRRRRHHHNYNIVYQRLLIERHDAILCTPRAMRVNRVNV